MIKRLWISLLACFVLTHPTLASDPFSSELPRVSWSAAPDHVGERCIVYGTIVSTKNIGSRCFLNFDADFRNTFTVVIGRGQFGDFSQPPEKLFAEKNVEAVGKIVPWQNKTEIVLESAEHIRIVEGDKVLSPLKSKASSESVGEASSSSSTTPPLSSSATDSLRKKSYKTITDGVIRVATFNVLNLFDDYDDPYVENERSAKASDELGRIAQIIQRIDADVVALQEVENRPFLETFVKTYLAGAGYEEVVLIEGNDRRGIDVACLSRFPIEWVRSHRHMDFADAYGNPMRFRRDLLEVRIAPAGYVPLDLYVVHLKSKHGGSKETEAIRLGEAAAVRDLLDRRLARDPNALFAVCGDLNDQYQSKPTQRLVGQGPIALRSFHDTIDPSNCVTYNRPEHASMIDFILASPQLAKLYVEDSFTIYRGQIETIGSDHNPVVAAFKLPRRVK